jgi:mRNA-degrading endonuclease RelE of RelBE toxin-antitoxin system
MAFTITLTKPAQSHLETIDRKHHHALRDAILEQLRFEPLVETRNCKTLDPAIFGATWELRCSPDNRYRVIYEVTNEDDEEHVTILAIGEKRGSQLLIAGIDITQNREENA